MIEEVGCISHGRTGHDLHRAGVWGHDAHRWTRQDALTAPSAPAGLAPGARAALVVRKDVRVLSGAIHRLTEKLEVGKMRGF